MRHVLHSVGVLTTGAYKHMQLMIIHMYVYALAMHGSVGFCRPDVGIFCLTNWKHLCEDAILHILLKLDLFHFHPSPPCLFMRLWYKDNKWSFLSKVSFPFSLPSTSFFPPLSKNFKSLSYHKINLEKPPLS